MTAPDSAWPEALLLFERSRPGRRAGRPPRPAVPVPDLPEGLRRSRPPRLPELSEPELVRHFTTLADRTFGVDTGFYPLGSCTMKHNPRVHERLAGLPGFRDLHPHQEDEAAQGALELMFRLQEMLAEIAGLPAVTLQPAAGSQGELTGLMLMRAYFADRGEERDTIVTPDTAHGTNPASVTMAGYKLEKVATDARGNLDLDDLRGKVNERTAGLMLRWFGRFPTHDATNNFRLYDAAFVREVGIESTGGFEVAIELTAKAFRRGLRVGEVPTTWRDRAAGESRFRMWRWIPRYLRWWFYALIGFPKPRGKRP